MMADIRVKVTISVASLKTGKAYDISESKDVSLIDNMDRGDVARELIEKIITTKETPDNAAQMGAIERGE